MDTTSAIQRIERDFEQDNSPFDNIEFPETRLMWELKTTGRRSEKHPAVFDMEKRARIVTIFCTFDYNRNANQLVNNLIELYETSQSTFVPNFVAGGDADYIQTMFEDIGFRYPNRDARGWKKNCQILQQEYNGNVTELILSVRSNATQLVDQLNDDNFLYLKGDKIAPMFCRILNDEVAPLDELWQLDIPVDTHIAKLTQELTKTEMSNDDVRAWWAVIGEQENIARHVVDGGLWLIGNNWNDWGKEYFSKVTGIEQFEYM